MGVEYPVLAFIAGLLFASIVLATLFLYIYVTNEVSKVPVLSGSAEAWIVANTTTVQVKVAHERGESVKLEKVVLTSEEGMVECTIPARSCTVGNVSITLVGFEDSTLLTGSTGFIIIKAYGLSFKYGKSYSIALFFDKGTLSLKFSITYIVS